MKQFKGFQFFSRKTSASTLIEVVVAMIIITVFIGIFFNFLVKLNRENNIRLKTDAQLLINNEADSAFHNMPFNDSITIFGPIKIIRNEDSSKYKKIELLTFKAYNNDHCNNYFY